MQKNELIYLGRYPHEESGGRETDRVAGAESYGRRSTADRQRGAGCPTYA